MNSAINRLIFEAWMEQYHPNYGLIWGLIFLAETAFFIFALGSIFFAIWWWKILIFSVGLALVSWFIKKGHSNIIHADFSSGQYPIKRNKND